VLAPDQHYADRFYLAAEAVSGSDRKTLTGKREIYKLHQHCGCVLTVLRIDATSASMREPQQAGR
jgi:hypothetical protein